MTTSTDNRPEDKAKPDKVTPGVEPLFYTKGLWLSLLIPLVFAGLLLSTALYGTEFTLSWTPQGFRNFYEYFKLPLAIATLSIPLGALTAAHHRSLQTFEQTKSQNQQNLFNNHIQHKKEFREFFEELRPFKDLDTFNSWEMYEAIFPQASEGIHEADPDIHKILDEIIFAQSQSISQFDLIETGEQTSSSAFSLAIGGFFMAGEIYKKIGVKLDLFSERYDKPEAFVIFFEDLFTVADGLISCCNFQYPSIPKEKRKKVQEENRELHQKAKAFTQREEIASIISDEISSQVEETGQLLYIPTNIQQIIVNKLFNDLFVDTKDTRRKEMDIILNSHLQIANDQEKQKFNEIREEFLTSLCKLSTY